MKKKITLVMALCIALCGLAGCSGGTPEAKTAATAAAATTTTTASAEAETTTTAATTAATESETTTATTTAAEKEDAPAAEGIVIYDANDIKITAGEFTTCKEYDDEPALALDIVNNTGKELTLYKLPMSMGGWMEDLYCLTVDETGYINMDGTFTIPAENDTNRYYLHVGNFILEKYGLAEIPDIEFGFEIYAGEDAEEPFMTDLVDIVNPAYTVTPEYDESGEVMYDKDGVKIVMQGETYDADYWGPQIKLYASNNSDKTVFIRIPETTLDGTAFEAFGDMIIAPGKRLSEEVLFGFIGTWEISITEIEPVSEITMKFDIYEYDQQGDNILLDSSEPITVNYDASTVEKVSAYSDSFGEEVQLSEEELAALKGWWTREGDYRDDENNSVTVQFVDSAFDPEDIGWYVNGNFHSELYWGGVLGLSDDGLSGTAETMTFNVSGEYNPGDPIEVKLAEDGDDGILLTPGTGEEYHLVPVTY